MKNAQDEYKLLGMLFENASFFNRLSINLFTENRKALYSSFRSSLANYGEITLEGVRNYYGDTLPSELFISVVKNPEPLIDNLTRLAKKRAIAEASTMLMEIAQEEDPDIQSLDFLNSLNTRPDINSTLEVGSIQFLNELHSKNNGDYDFTRTGFRFLDIMLGGEWPKGDVSAVMADPGGSKTSLVCNSMLRMGMSGRQSLFFSLEMSKQALISRWVSDYLSIDNMDLRLGNVESIEEVVKATNYINSLPMYVVDTPSLSVYDMIPIIRDHIYSYNIKVVFVDYLQIVRVGDDRNKELGEVVLELKNLAKKYNIHVCVLSQKNGKDGVWGIRDTGNAPAILDIAMDLHPDESSGDIKSITVDFKKNRNGRMGSVPVLFDGRYLRFVDEGQ